MLQPKTLYLVDDDTDDLDLFCEAVHVIDDSIVCVRSTDSYQALKAFKQHDIPVPDLIFLDLNMPVIDGRQFLSELKRLRPYSQIPVIIYSTSSHPKDVADTRELGAADFLTKPYSLNDLVSNLSVLISNYWQIPATEGSQSNDQRFQR
jgi:CheY-like chemotaxis protein